MPTKTPTTTVEGSFQQIIHAPDGGGSAYQPQTSHWYFPQAYRLDRHGKYLLMAPGRDRSACIGFRCVVDAR